MRIALVIAVVFAVIAMPSTAQEAIRNGDPFTLSITDVRSISPEKRVGFSKTLEVYAVTAYGPNMSYVLYCAKAGPHAGQTYTALDEYVSADYSWLHLWPVEKKNLNLLSDKSKKKGRLYRVIIIQNMLPQPNPDLACDIYSEAAQRAVPK